MKQAFLLFSLLFLANSACRKDFEEINKNPFSPTETSMEALFNGIISSLPFGWDEQFYLNNETLYDLTQQGALIARSWPNTRIGVDQVWNNYYTTLRNIRALEKRFDEYPGSPDELDNVRAQLLILRAFKTFKVTDLFGDIPFSEAGRGGEGEQFLRPKYDTQESIYRQLLTDLEWAATHLNNAPNAPSGQPFYSFRTFDTMLKSDLNLWRRWANSMRLRHAMRMVERDPVFSGNIIRDIIENNLPIIRSGEEICLWPRQIGIQFESHLWSFAEHKNLRMGSTIWHQMAVHDSTDGSGIIDPRAAIFFETNNKNEWRAFPNEPGANPPLEGGIPYNPGRDFNWSVKGTACLFSPFNYYLIRDQYDVPEILMTAAEVHFLLAEAQKRGIGVAQSDLDADINYNEGIKASLVFWSKVASSTQIWVENQPPSLTNSQIFQFIYHPKISFFGNGYPLELIYAQQWLDHFRQPQEAWALSRRTGKTPREGGPLTFNRFPYPASESEYNQANWQAQVAKMGGADAKETRVWWMN